MKFEEVIQHLRDGGRVTNNGNKYSTYDINDIFKNFKGYDLLNSEWVIINKSYKKEHIVYVNPDHYGCYLIQDSDKINLKDLFPKIKSCQTGKYKVTIEEID
jgi:hypothetical protein